MFLFYRFWWKQCQHPCFVFWLVKRHLYSSSLKTWIVYTVNVKNCHYEFNLNLKRKSIFVRCCGMTWQSIMYTLGYAYLNNWYCAWSVCGFVKCFCTISQVSSSPISFLIIILSKIEKKKELNMDTTIFQALFNLNFQFMFFVIIFSILIFKNSK